MIDDQLLVCVDHLVASVLPGRRQYRRANPSQYTASLRLRLRLCAHSTTIGFELKCSLHSSSVFELLNSGPTHEKSLSCLNTNLVNPHLSEFAVAE
jgi:hypothetical protein